MHDIDFLPNEYRQKHARRQWQPWQIVVAAAVAALLAAATIAQGYRCSRLQNDLATIAPVYDAAVSQRNRLSKIEEQQKTATARAELYTYLRHPWPRSQLLTALAAPLPDSVTLRKIQILREAPAGAPPMETQWSIGDRTEEERAAALAPAHRDLAKYVARSDPMQTIVVLTGTAVEVAALHRYLGELDAADIFDKAELDSIEVVDGNKSGGVIQFRAVLVVQPGYGQPGGPTEPRKKDFAGGKPA